MHVCFNHKTEDSSIDTHTSYVQWIQLVYSLLHYNNKQFYIVQ